MKLEDACNHLINLLFCNKDSKEFKDACKYYNIKAS